ncbi:shikimate dehydrogenase [Aliikangiella marina]|uniref:Shikimate dehydrogenase (NADP(+)) n=1 Tax=Aliikangiella marina TaxID=1712262 RepID=A0A545T4W9_9GAMM|nr:shikimate dehydrogenase [Aliikangiella marina]TQV72281.1 shikimate dehydrogenase [Aliikangiella marina]
MTVEFRLGVIGNPISHSLSPPIHYQFAQQVDISIEYQKHLVEENNLKSFVRSFFEQGGQGLNVTLPFKQAVIECADKVTLDAELAGSVNTLFKNESNQIVGTTTDGNGLLIDLQRLGFEYQNKHILVVGAGGACQSIILSLLSAGARVSMLNRTKAKVDLLLKRFDSLGPIDAYQATEQPDAIISTVSEFNPVLFDPLSDLVSQTDFCYDLNYGQRAEQFIHWCKANGASNTADGFGMLLGQAAESFNIWTGQRPDIQSESLFALAK